MEKRNNKNKKRLLILVALVGVMGIGGVVAATSISINSGAPLSLGAGYATATTCDTDVAITTAQAYDGSANIFKITGFDITGVDIASTNPTTGLGCGATTPNVMQLAVVAGASVYNASWTLASAASSDTRVYTFGATAGGTVVNPGATGIYYASVALTSFSIANLTTVALSIA
jgi:hypothetical protein